MIALRATLLAALLAALPRAAEACAVCTSGRADETRVAFIATTAFMTAMPLLLVGGLVLYLRRRLHKLRSLQGRS